VPEFAYIDMLPIGKDPTPYRLLTADGVRLTEIGGRSFLEVAPEALTLLAETAFHDIAHFLRPTHLAQLRLILDDPEASDNDKWLALELLQNANGSAEGGRPLEHDAGTAVVMGQRGQQVLTAGPDEKALALGVHSAYTKLDLQYAQKAPLTMWDEADTGTNLPAQIEIHADTDPGHETTYKFLFMAEGGSANQPGLFRQTAALLDPAAMTRFLEDELGSLAAASAPPYHLAVVVGGPTAEFALRTARLASAKYLDTLPTAGSPIGHGFRDLDLEQAILELTRGPGFAARFGGKYFCHDVRVVRLPRPGESLPVAISFSSSADRQCLGKITPEGVFIEQLETEPGRHLTDVPDLVSVRDVLDAPDLVDVPHVADLGDVGDLAGVPDVTDERWDVGVAPIDPARPTGE
jgi:fumarate hydratase class I